MSILTPRQVARRAVLAPDALYRRSAHDDVPRSKTTLVLHLLLLLAVIHQLISSEIIDRPLPGESPSTLFLLHEYVGMATLGVVFAFWLWTLVRQGETNIGKLFPWLFPHRIAAIAHDVRDQLRAILGGNLSGGSSGALASAVHGLGLLIVTAMAMTGTVLFFSDGLIFHYAMSLHRVTANLMWAYLIGHGSLGVVHHLLGSNILRRMFGIRRGITVTGELPHNVIAPPFQVQANPHVRGSRNR